MGSPNHSRPSSAKLKEALRAHSERVIGAYTDGANSSAGGVSLGPSGRWSPPTPTRPQPHRRHSERMKRMKSLAAETIQSLDPNEMLIIKQPSLPKAPSLSNRLPRTGSTSISISTKSPPTSRPGSGKQRSPQKSPQRAGTLDFKALRARKAEIKRRPRWEGPSLAPMLAGAQENLVRRMVRLRMVDSPSGSSQSPIASSEAASSRPGTAKQSRPASGVRRPSVSAELQPVDGEAETRSDAQGSAPRASADRETALAKEDEASWGAEVGDEAVELSPEAVAIIREAKRMLESELSGTAETPGARRRRRRTQAEGPLRVSQVRAGRAQGTRFQRERNARPPEVRVDATGSWGAWKVDVVAQADVQVEAPGARAKEAGAGQAREGWAASTAPAAASASPGDSPPASPRRGAAAVQRGVLRGRLLLELPSGAKGVGGASPPRAAMQVSGRRPGQDRSAPAQGSAAFLSSGREGRAPAAQGPPGHAQQHTVLSVSTVPMSGTDVAVGNARVEAKQAPWPAQQTHGHAHASTTGDVQGRGQAPRDTAGAGPSFRTLVMSGEGYSQATVDDFVLPLDDEEGDDDVDFAQDDSLGNGAGFPPHDLGVLADPSARGGPPPLEARRSKRLSLGRVSDLQRIPENEVAHADELEVEQQIEALATDAGAAQTVSGLPLHEDPPWAVTWVPAERADDAGAGAAGPGATLSLSMILAEAEADDVGQVDVVHLTQRDLCAVDPRGLNTLLELKELDLSENYLPDLACLAGLYCLQTLLVPLNTLRTVGPLSDDAFLRLTTLDVSYNCLASDALQTLGDLPSLEHLDLSGNDLGALPSEVGPFSSLRKLVLANCGIDGAALLPLAPLPSLEELYMGDNRVVGIPKGVSVAGHFPALHTLDLSNNRVALEQHIAPLGSLPALKRVYLLGNPLPKRRRDKAGLGGQLVFQAVPSSTPPTAEVMPDPRDGTRVRVRTPSTLDPALAVGATARQAPRDAPRAAAPTGEQARTLAARRAQHLMGGVFLDVREHGAGGRGKARDDPFLGMEVLGELRVDELTGEVAQDWDMSGALVSVPHDRVLLAFSRIHHVVESDARLSAVESAQRAASLAPSARMLRSVRSPDDDGIFRRPQDDDDAAEAQRSVQEAPIPVPSSRAAGSNANMGSVSSGLAASAGEQSVDLASELGRVTHAADGTFTFSLPDDGSHGGAASGSGSPRLMPGSGASGARRSWQVASGDVGIPGLPRGRKSNLLDGLEGVVRQGSALETIPSVGDVGPSGSLSDLGPSSSQMDIGKERSGMFSARRPSPLALHAAESEASMADSGTVDEFGDDLDGDDGFGLGLLGPGARWALQRAEGGGQRKAQDEDPTAWVAAELRAAGLSGDGADAAAGTGYPPEDAVRRLRDALRHTGMPRGPRLGLHPRSRRARARIAEILAASRAAEAGDAGCGGRSSPVRGSVAGTAGSVAATAGTGPSEIDVAAGSGARGASPSLAIALPRWGADRLPSRGTALARRVEGLRAHLEVIRAHLASAGAEPDSVRPEPLAATIARDVGRIKGVDVSGDFVDAEPASTSPVRSLTARRARTDATRASAHPGAAALSQVASETRGSSAEGPTIVDGGLPGIAEAALAGSLVRRYPEVSESSGRGGGDSTGAGGAEGGPGSRGGLLRGSSVSTSSVPAPLPAASPVPGPRASMGMDGGGMSGPIRFRVAPVLAAAPARTAPVAAGARVTAP